MTLEGRRRLSLVLLWLGLACLLAAALAVEPSGRADQAAYTAGVYGAVEGSGTSSGILSLQAERAASRAFRLGAVKWGGFLAGPLFLALAWVTSPPTGRRQGHGALGKTP